MGFRIFQPVRWASEPVGFGRNAWIRRARRPIVRAKIPAFKQPGFSAEPPVDGTWGIRRFAGMGKNGEKIAKHVNLWADLASNGSILRIAAKLTPAGGVITPPKPYICRNPFDVIDLLLVLCRRHEKRVTETCGQGACRRLCRHAKQGNFVVYPLFRSLYVRRGAKGGQPCKASSNPP
jgi:hypothetical protein